MKHICKCGNEIEDINNPNAIDIQWTTHYGCELCQKLIDVQDSEIIKQDIKNLKIKIDKDKENETNR